MIYFSRFCYIVTDIVTGTASNVTAVSLHLAALFPAVTVVTIVTSCFALIVTSVVFLPIFSENLEFSGPPTRPKKWGGGKASM